MKKIFKILNESQDGKNYKQMLGRICRGYYE